MIQVRFILHILTIFNEMHSSFVFPLYLPTCLPEARACSITIHLFTYSSVYMGPGRRNSASLCHLKYDILKIWSPNMKLWDRIHVSLSFCGCIYFNLCPYFVKPQATFPPPHCRQFASSFTILYVCKVPGHGTFWFSSQRWPKGVFTHTFSLGRRTRIVCVTVSHQDSWLFSRIPQN